jgi:hypothetical protein
MVKILDWNMIHGRVLVYPIGRAEILGSNQQPGTKRRSRATVRITPIIVDIDANGSSGCSGCVSSRASMIVIDKGASSGADTTLESIQLPHRLRLLDPRQEQRQLKAVAARYGKDIKLFRETKSCCAT